MYRIPEIVQVLVMSALLVASSLSLILFLMNVVWGVELAMLKPIALPGIALVMLLALPISVAEVARLRSNKKGNQ